MSVLNVLFACFGAAMAAGTTDFFPEAKDNLTRITWAHAVNSRALLENALNGSANMLEADVVMGTLTDGGSSEEIPVMGHPPANTSDLSLQDFLGTIGAFNRNATGKKGVKLDFKTTEVFNGSLDLLASVYPTVDYPLWLNADILRGPLDSTATPVDPAPFLTLSKNFANSTLSIGWTTNYGSNFSTTVYTDRQIAEMLETLKSNAVNQPVTFAVRAGIAAESTENMLVLLRNVSGSTLTVWSSEGDRVNVTNLRGLVKAAGLDRVYVDVPEDLRKELRLDTISSAPGAAALGCLLVIAGVLVYML